MCCCDSLVVLWWRVTVFSDYVMSIISLSRCSFAFHRLCVWLVTIVSMLTHHMDTIAAG